MIQNVYLGLGSNIEDRLNFINTAASYLGSCSDIQVVSVSSIYETEPWGVKEQNKFLNCVMKISTGFTPLELLNFVKETEIKTGRVKRDKWYEREIDIDILFYNDSVVDTEGYSIPHKEIANRRFVLTPLSEIDGEFIHPVLKKTVNELLKITKDNSEVYLYKT